VNVYAVIMAGGAGTRFWPASREKRPKQLLGLLPDAGGSPLQPRGAGESLLAATVRRLAPIAPAERVYVATGAHLAEAIAAALPEVPRAQILAEPVPRNTAPGIGWAVATVARRDPEALVAVVPSDHFVANEDEFLAAVRKALEGTRARRITTIGIAPTRAEPGYGYIELGRELSPGLHDVARFVEKPDRARAEAYVSGGKHLWNAGMFFFRARDMREAITRFLPDLAAGLDRLDEAAARGEEAEALAREFPRMPAISIDHGVMEKAPDIAVVRAADFGWSDVGSWQSAWELAEKDAEGNALPSGAVAVDARGNLVRDLREGPAARKVFALVGVSDLVVVDTGDALLVIPRERAQDVREVTRILRERGDYTLL
jgi:mannose-1-phosphate guanylyltransferase